MPATAARKAFVGQDLRWESAAGVSTTAYPAAEEMVIETLLDVLADAQSLAAAKASLYAAGKKKYSFEVYKMQHRLKRGDTITLKHIKFIPAGISAIVWLVREHVGEGRRSTYLEVFG